MKTLWLVSLMPLFLVSCGYVSKSTLHTRKEWKVYEANRKHPLPDVTLKVGERKQAYKHRVGFPPLFGGYVPTLVAEDNGVVRTSVSERAMGWDTMIVGKKPGVARVYPVNLLGLRSLDKRRLVEDETPIYSIRVTP